MITLIKAQVLKYKSIEDSSPVELAGGVTVLVGKNESRKTAFLEALHKALPVENAKLNFVFDYPRKDYVRYRPQHDAKSYAKVVELTVPFDQRSKGFIWFFSFMVWFSAVESQAGKFGCPQKCIDRRRLASSVSR